MEDKRRFRRSYWVKVAIKVVPPPVTGAADVSTGAAAEVEVAD